MKKLMLFVLFLILSKFVFSQMPWNAGKLVVSENGRYLQHDNGDPFFWLGDTGWLLFQRLNREQAIQYIENRKAKGFTVIQCIFHQNYAHTNAYGDTAYSVFDITKPIITPGNDPKDEEQYDYWDHVEFIIDIAAENGMYIAMVTSWRDLHKQVKDLNKEKAEVFAAHLANFFKDKPNIIWINGGSAKGYENSEFWVTVGETIKKTDPNHLVSFHPFGRMQTSEWFQNSSWLDLNMFVSGHRSYEQDNTTKAFGEDNWRYVLEDLSKTPVKPTIDGEPSYENLPEGIHDHSMPYWKASDVRRYAYWSVFAGACGHVYGENTVRQVHLQGINQPESGAKLDFFEALDAPGAFQMQYVKNLILSRPYFERVNDQSVVAGDEGEKYDRILVTRGNDYLMAYTFIGRKFTLQMGKISGEKVNAWWYDTRTGEAYAIGEYDNRGTVSFDPPGAEYNGNDWVLVLDNASREFSRPGIAIDY
ncbi:MAG: glycoside hydrolase family 140 protein [Bacteroidales bacterium]|nr:glycoside hydrolase family 140 protein [Bacteroidales bacterium]